MPIKNRISNFQNDMIKWRHYFHENPETAYNEINTSKKIVEMVRNNGAKNVYFASAAPPVRHQNVYGIDMPATKELVAHGRNIEEIKDFIGADELIYQDIEALRMAAHVGNTKIMQFEDSVFTGEYCAGKISKDYLEKLETSRVNKK